MGQVDVASRQAPRVVALEDEIRGRFLDYAMSVILARALPDVRDGMKPVHRRILFGMHVGGYVSDKPYRKSARIVGDVMGKYHPHGDASIYDTMVRLAQPFKLSIPLIDGQGNYGSVDDDPPAAMRYTEARLSRLADDGICQDLSQGRIGDLGAVDFKPNYDNTEREPTVLPVRFPCVLVTGQDGIAVGMATRIPPHNLAEVIDATLALIDKPDLDIETLMHIMPGPDFATGGVIMGRGAIKAYYETGRGSIAITGTHIIEDIKGGRQQIVLTALPFGVNKKALIERIAELAREKDADKVIEGISNATDESSNRDGTRVVIELKRDVDPNVVIQKLRKRTAYQTSFSANMVFIASSGKPATMGVLPVLREWLIFRREVILRRSETLLHDAQRRLTTQVALYAARTAVDDVIRVIRGSGDTNDAKAALMAMDFACDGEFAVLVAEADPDVPPAPIFKLSEQQAADILALRLSSLTKLEGEAIARKAREILAEIRVNSAIIQDPAELDLAMKNELIELRAKFAEPRRTKIEAAGPDDIDDDEFVENKPVVITLTRKSYIKCSPLAAYREQSRGGKGKTGMDTKEDDFVVRTLVTTARTQLLFITTRGIAHLVKAYRLPEAPPNGRGRPLVNSLPTLRQGEGIAAILPIPSDPAEVEGKSMVFVTDHGDARRNAASDFMNVNKAGKIAMRLEDDLGRPIGSLVDVLMCGPTDDIVIATRKGKAVRFSIDELRVFNSRTSTGVTGVKLGTGDSVVGASVLIHSDASPQEREAYFAGGTHRWKDDAGQEQTLTLSPDQMETMRATEQFLVTVSALGFGKRFSTHEFRVSGRNTQGVGVGTFRSDTGDMIASFPVTSGEGLVLVTDGGQVIRIPVDQIRTAGRTTRGVKLFDLPAGQTIVDVARVPAEEDADPLEAGNRQDAAAVIENNT